MHTGPKEAVQAEPQVLDAVALEHTKRPFADCFGKPLMELSSLGSSYTHALFDFRRTVL
jgi:hypothetical protein